MKEKVNEYESWSKENLQELLVNIEKHYDELADDGKKDWLEEQKQLIQAQL